MGRGIRYNQGKLRYELVPHYPLKELVKVYTLGAHKYSIYADGDGKQYKGTEVTIQEVKDKGLTVVYDAANNWRHGLSWTQTMAAVKRHIAEWDAVKDMDDELGTLHLANAAWGLFTLIEFSKTYKQGDDRPLRIFNIPRVALDIDEVLADFTGGWSKAWKDPEPRPISWNYDRNMKDRFDEMAANGTLDPFFLGLSPKIRPEDIPFEPVCYVTSRPVSSEISEKWLDAHGFPQVPVYTVPYGTPKSEILKDLDVDIFVDDSFSNFVDINSAGILCLLWDAPHNKRYNVGARRIESLRSIIDYDKIYE